MEKMQFDVASDDWRLILKERIMNMIERYFMLIIFAMYTQEVGTNHRITMRKESARPSFFICTKVSHNNHKLYSTVNYSRPTTIALAYSSQYDEARLDIYWSKLQFVLCFQRSMCINMRKHVKKDDLAALSVFFFLYGTDVSFHILIKVMLLKHIQIYRAFIYLQIWILKTL